VLYLLVRFDLAAQAGKIERRIGCNWSASLLFKGESLLARDDLIPAEGTIIDKQPNAFFKVQLDNTDHVVLAAVSGKMRKNRIRILVGDRVSVEMSPYDLSRGRITYRFK
jgi:translation initiation factor IF-1